MLAGRVESVVEAWVTDLGLDSMPVFFLERPADESHGDYATPVCLQLAKLAGRPPRVLAEELRERVLADDEAARLLAGVEVAGPGFVNFTLSGDAYALMAKEMLVEGDSIGKGAPKEKPGINLEFVSVNPNGPLHVGHGRYAAYGDALRRILRFGGANLKTEFYINDYGRQMERFGRSIAARYAQSFGVELPVPSDGYQGEYVVDIAATLRDKVGERYLKPLRLVAEALASSPSTMAAESVEEEPDDEEEAGTVEDGTSWTSCDGLEEAVGFFRDEGCAAVLGQMREELEDFGVAFDVWFSETDLHTSGRLEGVVDRLLKSGEAYKEGEAVWLRTTARGDDKDRVLIRKNGHPTYFAADIAYHESKLERGFDHLVDIWGADHHGYVQRMKAAVEILSGSGDTLEVIIGQLVNVLEKGELRQMSTRRGEMVTLAELVEAIGRDAARFFLVSRSQDQTLDLDLDLARRQSQENPVYYVQYAHARIASILRNVPEDTEASVGEGQEVYGSVYERALIKKLASFGEVVEEAAERRAPHRIASYAQEVAADFHVFYKHCRVLGVKPVVSSSRLGLCLVAKRVIARCLELLGVSAPESM